MALKDLTSNMNRFIKKVGICKADFDPGFFYNPDFHTTTKNTNSYTNWFLYCLNEYFFKEDTNKDMYGEGTLTRYLGMMGSELDEEVIPYIECLLNIVDAQTTDAKFLNHLAEVVGSPPNITFDEQSFRNLLTYIISIYKVKGTRKSYELFFGLLGYHIQLIELTPIEITNKYDNKGLYDENLIYDNNSCQPCSQYDIILFPYNISKPLTKDVMDRIMSAIELNEPINAKLRYLKMGYSFEDSIKVNILEDTNITNEFINLYDVDKHYDSLEIYDESIEEFIPTLIIPMRLDINNNKGKLNIIIRFETIDQIENIKNNINVTIIADNLISGTTLNINTVTNYVYDEAGYDSYISLPSRDIPLNYTNYFIQIDITLKNGSKVSYKSLYSNITSNTKETHELYFG